MKLAAKIFAALALALAISYVANWSQAPDASAAAGKIDVLNVGTCYATSSSVFGEAECRDNTADQEDSQYALDSGSGNSGLQNLKVTARPFATYAVDPKTSAEEPRAILMDADLIKISIADPGRDRRTPVLLRAGGDATETRITPLVTADIPTGVGCYNNDTNARDVTPRVAGAIDALDRELCEVHYIINGTTSSPKDNLYDYTLHQTFVNSAAVGSSVIFDKSRASGNVVRVNIPDLRANDEDYLPLHRKFDPANPNNLSDDTVIRFFGYVTNMTPTGTIFGCERVAPASAVTPVAASQEDVKICDLGRIIKLDEDIGEGRARGEFGDGSDANARSAPFIEFGTVLAGGDSVHVRYVYYETSEREEIVGGKKSKDKDTYDGADLAEVNPPVFTDDETADADETNPDLLLVQATGDGVGRSQNLWLKETGRFDGTYVGYLRLTDANGNAVVTGGVSEDNWGRQTTDAASSELDGAAVLGVQGGPVTIRYKDSDGNTKELRILVDTQPPIVSIDSPDYKANFDEQRIRITGTFNDADSGLRDDSFRLYLDNIDDDREDGENGGTPVLNLPVKEGANTEGGANAVGLVTPQVSGGVVQLTGDYIGYAVTENIPEFAQGLFGILKAPWIFQDLVDASDDSVDLETITPETFRDGANEGTFDDVARLNIQSGNGDEVPDDQLNNQVDFQALVMDIAGNVGFSDSDPTGPTFIHDYGTESNDRKDNRYNVLGWYARHIISIDRLDPRLGRVVTGFYDENDDDEPLMENRGLMLIFDAAVDGSSVDNSTFKVELDAVGSADPVDAIVQDNTTIGKRVYLLLAENLLPDATPKLSVNSGRSVRDPAGNSLTSNDPLNGDDDGDRTLEADDGIPPTLEVTLSRGSGTGTGQEDSSNLTMDAIVVRVTSNEDIQGAPYVSFVCDGFTWIDTKDNTVASDDETLEFSNFLANRRGTQNTSQHDEFEPNTEKGTCGDDEGTRLIVPSTPTYSRPGNTWEYQWRNNTSGTDTAIPDGDVTVVAFGRDVSAWNDDWDPDREGSPDAGMPSFNWGAATAEFELDTNLGDPSTTNSKFGSVQPRAGSDIFESRPFVLLTFTDASTVTIDSFKVDGTEQEITTLPNNRFLYWPESLSFGKHEVEVEAVDAAANERDFSYEFEVKERTAFTVELLAGWNAVSVPAMPIDPNIGAVFTIDEVDQVVGWDSATPAAPWRIATKVDGIWSTDAENAPLDTILAGKGYWVHANGFVDQTVMLAGNPDRESAGNAPDSPIGITTVKGWNFVGVVDTDGDQTQDGDFGEMLKDSKQEMVDAESYLRNFKQAYTWDPIKNQFNVIEDGDGMSIGDGVWVYYAEDFNIAP